MVNGLLVFSAQEKDAENATLKDWFLILMLNYETVKSKQLNNTKDTN